MIEGPCLVLNRSYLPVHITSIKRAICLVFKGLAQVVDQHYQTYDFQSWSELSQRTNSYTDAIKLTNGNLKIPRVIMLTFYDKLPSREVRFNRVNIFARDKNTCQYCGNKFKRPDLNLDHVVPISQGGETSWFNVVCSCIPCNSKKGGRTPRQAHMKLLSKPKVPPYSIFMNVSPQPRLIEAWKTYMNPIDFAYWCLELKS